MQTDNPPEFINNNDIEDTNKTNTKKLVININDEYEGLVPPLPDKDYQELKESIKKDGQFFPITVNDKGEILDGRHRFRSCQELSIEPKIEVKKFDNPLDEKRFVIESNLKRRHLEIHERAALATELQSVEEEAAKGRQKLSQFSETNQPVKRLGKILPNREEKEENKPKPDKNKEEGTYKQREENKSRERAAKQAKLSDETLRKYQYVLSNGKPDLVEKMTSGKIKIDKAYKMQKQDEFRQKLLESTHSAKELDKNNCDLRNGDFRNELRDIPDNSIDLIVTDPPYSTEHLHVYSELASSANRVLKPGGSIVTYIGQHNLPEILEIFRSNNLKFWWPIAVKHTGGTKPFHQRKVFVLWKPLLWFVKGEKISSTSPIEALNEYLYDYVESKPADKMLHPMEQSPVEAEHVIRKLTVENQTVLDPMMGSGTTGIAALNLKRKFIGIEKDHEKFLIAKARIEKKNNNNLSQQLKEKSNSNLGKSENEKVTLKGGDDK